MAKPAATTKRTRKPRLYVTADYRSALLLLSNLVYKLKPDYTPPEEIPAGNKPAELARMYLKSAGIKQTDMF